MGLENAYIMYLIEGSKLKDSNSKIEKSGRAKKIKVMTAVSLFPPP